MDIINIKNGGFPSNYPYQVTDSETYFLIGSGAYKGNSNEVDINLEGAKDGSRVFIKVNRESEKGSRVKFFTYEMQVSIGEISAFIFEGGAWKRFL